jgi:DNA invertase Pin-like site-specific DNA recombinase
MVNALKQLQSLSADFTPYQENIDTATPRGELTSRVIASLAQFESALISQQIRQHGGIHSIDAWQRVKGVIHRLPKQSIATS